MKKVNYWKITSIVLIIAVIILSYGNFTKKDIKKDKVTILEFSDFQCPYCARGEATIKQVKEYYGDKVEIIYKHFPLQFHQYSFKAAEASECARDQGKFNEYKEVLFENQETLDADSLKSYARSLNLDMNGFTQCLDNGEKIVIVNNDLKEGISMGVDGTPAFFVEGKMISGAQPFENFKAVIDSMLK